MMLCSFTPCSFSFAIVPVTRASMTSLFHRECTMATRRGEPSSFTGDGAGPLTELIVVQDFGSSALGAHNRNRVCVCLSNVALVGR